MQTIRPKFLLLTAGAMLLFCADIFACSCQFGGSAPCQEFWRADAVFAGTVVASGKIDVEEAGYKHDMRLVRFTVDQPIRGMQAAEVDVITGWGGGDCGYGFKMGQRYLVYGYYDETGKRLATSICTRTRLVSEADEDFAFIRAMPNKSANGLIFGTVGKRNYEWKEGEEWYKPVPDAELVIEGANIKYEARADEKGSFRVENVLPGKYLVKLKLPPGLILPSGKDESGQTAENEIEVPARGCAETEFFLESDTRVTGQVLNAKGEPIPNLQLNMRVAADPHNGSNNFLYATTDSNGRFEFRTVGPGQYWLGYHLLNSPLQEGQPYVRTYLPGVSSRALATIVKVKEGETISGLTLQMPAPLTKRTLSGIVLGADGRPVAGASVYVELIEDGDMSHLTGGLTDADGRFTLQIFAGLQYKISAYRQLSGSKGLQSEYIDVPLASDQPVRLVLPALPRN